VQTHQPLQNSLKTAILSPPPLVALRPRSNFSLSIANQHVVLIEFLSSVGRHLASFRRLSISRRRSYLSACRLTIDVSPSIVGPEPPGRPCRTPRSFASGPVLCWRWVRVRSQGRLRGAQTNEYRTPGHRDPSSPSTPRAGLTYVREFQGARSPGGPPSRLCSRMRASSRSYVQIEFATFFRSVTILCSLGPRCRRILMPGVPHGRPRSAHKAAGTLSSSSST
jgi:hypothetical protein